MGSGPQQQQVGDDLVSLHVQPRTNIKQAHVERGEGETCRPAQSLALRYARKGGAALVVGSGQRYPCAAVGTIGKHRWVPIISLGICLQQQPNLDIPESIIPRVQRKTSSFIPPHNANIAIDVRSSSSRFLRRSRWTSDALVCMR